MFDSQNAIFKKAQLNDASSVKRVVAVMSGKGGVGKSSVTALTAAELNRQGYRVGILDGDITGPSIPRLFGLSKDSSGQTELGLVPAKTAKGIYVMSINLLLPDETSPVVWRGPLIGNAIKQFFTDVIWDNLDILLVDLPPGTGDAPLSTLQSLPVDGVVIVSSPQDVAVMVVEKAINMVRMMNQKIVGLVENMSGVVCPHCGEKFDVLGESKGPAIVEQYGLPWLGAIPIDPKLAGAVGGSIEDYVSPVPDVIAGIARAVISEDSNFDNE